MPGNTNLTVSAVVLLGSAQGNFQASSPLVINNTKSSDLIQDITSSGAALSLGTCATVGLLIAQVVSSDDPAHSVSFYADAGYTIKIGSGITEGMVGVVLVAPSGTVYAKASAGTVQVRVFVTET
jgi:hypothetical protein